jgi:competence ComEA-like helix-hairpin-helix protein
MKSEGGFSAREVRALLWLLPVLAVVSWLVWEIARTQDWSASREEELSASGERTTPPDADAVPTPPVEEGRQEYDAAVIPTDGEDPAPRLFTFDPNTIEYHDLVRLGFERGEALGIIKYRERGKVFEIPEDFAACYQVSEAMYRRLETYIRIGEEFRLKRWAESSRSGGGGSTLTANATAAHSTERSREQPDGVVSTTTASRPLRPVPVDLNSADSAALIAVQGIGPATVMRIIEYRERLGGFAAVEQLAEVRGVTEQNYERMIEQIFVDPAVIQKIDINFAAAKSLASHPYVRAEALRKLLKERQLKGGWRTVEELEKDDIFTTDELVRLGPYLLFN